jgi:hypothetical protein
MVEVRESGAWAGGGPPIVEIDAPADRPINAPKAAQFEHGIDIPR